MQAFKVPGIVRTGRHLDSGPAPASGAPAAAESYPSHHPAPPRRQSQSGALPVQYITCLVNAEVSVYVYEVCWRANHQKAAQSNEDMLYQCLSGLLT